MLQDAEMFGICSCLRDGSFEQHLGPSKGLWNGNLRSLEPSNSLHWILNSDFNFNNAAVPEDLDCRNLYD